MFGTSLVTVSIMDYISQVVKLAPAFMVAVSFHECAHGLVACWLGDRTAKQAGRVSLNPLRHLDFFGTMLILIIGIGWARPVPINERNFSYPRLFSVLTAFAGPLANILVAIVFLYAVKCMPIIGGNIRLYQIIAELFEVVAQVNVMLAVFNMLPIPPLDGGHFLRALLPEKWQAGYLVFSQYAIFLWIFIIMIPQSRMFLFNTIAYVYSFIHHFVFG